MLAFVQPTAVGVGADGGTAVGVVVGGVGGTAGVVVVDGAGGAVGTWASTMKAMSAAMTASKESLCSLNAFVAMAYMTVRRKL